MDCNCKKLFVAIDDQSLYFFRQDGSDDTADYNFQMYLEALTYVAHLCSNFKKCTRELSDIFYSNQFDFLI
jgi:hypothetical protein